MNRDIIGELTSGPCKVIAEIGNNHGGDVGVARKKIRAAAECGAWGVKFQRRTLEACYTRALLAMPYDNPASYGAT